MSDVIQRSRSASINLFIGEGNFDVALRIDELIQLKEKTGFGPSRLLRNLQEGEWGVEELREIIRLGLIGGGMSKQEAFTLMTRHVVAGYLLDMVPVAMQIVFAALAGVEDDPVGEPLAATETTETETSSGLPTSE
jgi:hypothetical protein